jgi:glutathione S-transferase
MRPISGRAARRASASRWKKWWPDKSVEGFRKSLDPLRLTLKSQKYLGGEKPNYADYIVFGPFQWARVVSPFKLLAADDPVHAWRERLLDAFDGMARKSPGFAV